MYPWCVYSSHRLLSKLFIIRGMCFSNNFGRTGGFDLVEINFFFWIVFIGVECLT